MPSLRPLVPALALSAITATLAWAGQPMIPANGPAPADGPVSIRVGPAVAPAMPTPPVTPAPTAPAPADPFVRDLLAKLNSPDAAQRDAAQKQLVSISGLMQQPEVLKKLQEISTDQELKDFFASRITQLRALQEEKSLTNLPPITLKVSGVSLMQLTTELNKALGLPSAFMTDNNGGGFRGGNTGGSFTLDVADKPFWDVMSQLQEQQYFDIQNYGDGQPPRLTISGNRKSPYTTITGPALATITNISYDRSLNFQSPPNSRQQPSMNINVNLAVDPRIHASRVKNFTNVKVVDDEGRALQSPNNGGGYNGGNSIIFGMNLYIIPPDRLGKTMNISFDSAIATTVGDTKMTIDDITKNVEKPITMGARVVRISNLSMDNPNNANMTLNVEPADRTRGFNGDEPRTPFTIQDAAGRILYSASVSFGGMGFGFNTNGAKQPYKIEFSVPGRSFEIPVHFEFKEVPLP